MKLRSPRAPRCAKLEPSLAPAKRAKQLTYCATQIAISDALGRDAPFLSAAGEPPLSRAERALCAELADVVWRAKFQRVHPSVHAAGRHAAGYLMHEVARVMRQRVDGCARAPDVVYNSAHDGTLLSLFARLGVTDHAVPRFGASVVFELYELDAAPAAAGAAPSRGARFEVAMLYNPT